jgi:hypothetical protein
MATRKGYGQVERQHMAAPHNGQIYAQLPALDASGNAITQLENGQFLKYDYAHGKATTSGNIEWFLVYNEEKLYDERRQNHRDFVMKASDMSDGKIYPRLLRTFVGDIFTTNTFRTASTTSGSSKTYGNTVTGPDDTITIPDITIGDYVVINDEGWLEGVGSTLPETTGIIFQAVPHFTQMGMAAADRPAYTLPDEQWAVKLQRIQ